MITYQNNNSPIQTYSGVINGNSFKLAATNPIIVGPIFSQSYIVFVKLTLQIKLSFGAVTPFDIAIFSNYTASVGAPISTNNIGGLDPAITYIYDFNANPNIFSIYSNSVFITPPNNNYIYLLASSDDLTRNFEDAKYTLYYTVFKP